MSIQHITTLLRVLPKNPNFVFQGRYYEQVHGAVMGSPTSFIVVNLFMVEFEIKAINSAPIHPGCGLGMWMTLLSFQKQNMVTNLCSTSTPLTNTSSSPSRLLTLKVPFHLWTLLVSSGHDNTLFTTVYRKPSHTDQYIHWDSHHNLSAKYSLFITLTHRARTVCATLSCSLRRKDTPDRLYPGESTQCRHSIDSRLGIASNTVTHRPNPGQGPVTSAPTTSTW